MKDLLPIAAQAIEFFPEGIDFALGLQQCLRKRTAAAALADEVDEMREAPFFRGELRFLEPDRLGDVRVELRDLGLDPMEEVLDVLGVHEVRADGVEDQALNEAAPDQQFVLAGPFGRRDAAVVAAAFPAHLGHRGAALAADHRAGEEMRGEVLLPAALDCGEATPSRAAGPGAADVLAASLDAVPKVLRHDAECRILVDDPLGSRLGKGAPAAGAGIPAEFAFVPDPAADIFLVV